MPSPFTDERDRIEQALTFDTGCEPSAQEIIDALNRAGFQITPQAGEETRKDVEAAIANGWTRATQEKGSLWAAIADEIMKLIHPSNAEPIATVVNNNQPGWTAVIETAPNVTLDVGTKLYRTAPPPKVEKP